MPRESRKSGIEEAALRLFVEKGLNAATTKEIAALAGVSEGAIYRHFESKEELALALFQENMQRLLAHLTRSLDGADEPPAQLCAVQRAFLEFAVTEPLAYAYLMEAHTSEFAKLPRELARPKDVFVRVIQRGLAQGYFREMDPQLAAALVIGMTIRTAFFLKQGLIQQSREQVLEELGRAALRVLARD
jgi:AcrR family transcriptional regulator